MAVELNPDESLADNLVFAADALGSALERNVELFKIRPGVAILFLGPSSVELGGRVPFWVVLLNTSDEKVSVEVVPSFSKELGGDRLKRFVVELLPGQFDCVEFNVATTSKTGLKDYKIDVNVKSRSLKYRLARAGVGFASKVASELVPFSGVVVKVGGMKAVGNEIDIRKNLSVIKPKPKVRCLLKIDKDRVEFDLDYVMDDEKVLSEDFEERLVDAIKKHKHYAVVGGHRGCFYW